MVFRPFATLTPRFRGLSPLQQNTHIHICRCHSDTKSLAWVLGRLPNSHFNSYVKLPEGIFKQTPNLREPKLRPILFWADLFSQPWGTTDVTVFSNLSCLGLGAFCWRHTKNIQTPHPLQEFNGFFMQMSSRHCEFAAHSSGWWLIYPSEWWSESQLGWLFHSQLLLESHSKFHGSSHHQPVIHFASAHGNMPGWSPIQKPWFRCHVTAILKLRMKQPRTKFRHQKPGSWKRTQFSLTHRIHGAAIYGNIYHQYTPNVSIYTIHGSYG